MAAVYGISVCAGALRLLRTASDAIAAGEVSFDMKVVGTPERPTDREIRSAVRSLPVTAGDTVAVAAPEARLASVAHAVEDTPWVDVVEDTRAALAFVDFASISDAHEAYALVDIGATGSSVTIVDTLTRRRTETVHSAAAAGRMVDRIVLDHLRANGIIGAPASEDAERELYAFARTVKESLSASVLARAAGGDVELMARARLEELARPTVTACADNIAAAARECGAAIDEVILIGGMARMPLIKAVVEERVGVRVVVADEPEAVVAKGAALIAGAPSSTDDQVEPTVSAWLGGPPAGAERITHPKNTGSGAETVDGVLEPMLIEPSPMRPEPIADATFSARVIHPHFVSSDTVDTEVIEHVRFVDAATSDGPRPSVQVASPFDYPTGPFEPVESEIGSDAGVREGSPPMSTRIPRSAAMVLTAVAVASAVLWGVVRPGVAPATVAETVTESASASEVTTAEARPSSAPPEPSTVLPEPSRTIAPTTTTTSESADVIESDDVREPTYSPPARVSTVPATPTTGNAAPSPTSISEIEPAPDVQSPIERFGFEVPPELQDLLAPGF